MSLFLNLLFEQDSYSNEYLLAKFGFDTAENEPLKVCKKLAKVRIKVKKHRKTPSGLLSRAPTRKATLEPGSTSRVL